jgi:hypothetical protein
MGVVTKTFIQCDHRYCNSYSGYLDPCIDVKWLSYSFLSISTSYFTPWKCLGALSICNHLDVLYHVLYFSYNVLVHRPLQLS